MARLYSSCKEIYRGNKWIGGYFPDNYCGHKLKPCYSKNPTEIYFIEFNEKANIIEFKNKCRNLFNKGKHSLHISDDNIDTFRISSAVLNENSIHFLNNGPNNLSDNTKQLLLNYFNKLNNKDTNYCLTSSLILELYGLD